MRAEIHARSRRRRLVVVLIGTCAAAVLLCAPPAVFAQKERETGRRVGIDLTFHDLIHSGDKASAARKHAQAISFYTQALEMRPDKKNAHLLHIKRAYAFEELKNYGAAIADLLAASRLYPRDATVLNDLAWFRSVAPDPAVRDGKAAVRDALRACELSNWKASYFIDTLAAAHAENGEFEKAVEVQKRAIPLAPFSDRAGMHRRLRLYEQRQPYRLK